MGLFGSKNNEMPGWIVAGVEGAIPQSGDIETTFIAVLAPSAEEAAAVVVAANPSFVMMGVTSERLLKEQLQEIARLRQSDDDDL
jgi:hypothetical protein